MDGYSMGLYSLELSLKPISWPLNPPNSFSLKKVHFLSRCDKRETPQHRLLLIIGIALFGICIIT